LRTARVFLRRRPVGLELLAHVLLAPAELRRVDGDEERLRATTLRLLHELVRDRAVAVHVQLEEERLAGRARAEDLLHRARCERRDHLHDAVPRRRARQRHLAVRVSEPAERGRGDVHGHAARMPEQRRRPVDGRHVAHDARAEPDAMVRRVVLTMRDLVVRGGAVVCPRLVRKGLACDGLSPWRERHAGAEMKKPTSKSCRLRISEIAGTRDTRSSRAFSDSVTTTLTFSTVCMSTGPRLLECESGLRETQGYSLFLRREVCGDGVWRVDRLILLSAHESKVSEMSVGSERQLT
jgi:hypothetical protein